MVEHRKSIAVSINVSQIMSYQFRDTVSILLKLFNSVSVITIA